MNFDLTEDQVAIRDSVRKYAEAELLPNYQRWDKTGEWLTKDFMDNFAMTMRMATFAHKEGKGTLMLGELKMKIGDPNQKVDFQQHRGPGRRVRLRVGGAFHGRREHPPDVRQPALVVPGRLQDVEPDPPRQDGRRGRPHRPARPGERPPRGPPLAGRA